MSKGNRWLLNFQGGLVDICPLSGYTVGQKFGGGTAMDLGGTIYRLRTEHNLSQGDLAEALGVSRQSVSKWETGGSLR